MTTAVQQPNHVPSEVCVLHRCRLQPKILCDGERETDLGSQSSALLAYDALFAGGAGEFSFQHREPNRGIWNHSTDQPPLQYQLPVPRYHPIVSVVVCRPPATPPVLYCIPCQSTLQAIA